MENLSETQVAGYHRNLKAAREFVHKGHVLTDTTGRRFPFKTQVLELTAVILYLIDHELQVLAGTPKPELLVFAHLLLEATAKRLSPSQPPLKHYEVRFQVLGKKKQPMDFERFIHLPHDVDADRYALALYGIASNFIGSCKVSPLTDEEMELRETSRTKKVVPSENEFIYQKMREAGLVEMVEGLLKYSPHFIKNKPRDIPKFILDAIRGSETRGFNRDCFRLLCNHLAKPQEDVRFWHYSANGDVAFIVIDDKLRAMTFGYQLQNPEMPKILEMVPTKELSWTFLRNP